VFPCRVSGELDGSIFMATVLRGHHCNPLLLCLELLMGTQRLETKLCLAKKESVDLL
jgi:hypothetical protein